MVNYIFLGGILLYFRKDKDSGIKFGMQHRFDKSHRKITLIGKMTVHLG